MQVGQHLGPFTVEKEVGSGAMGTVYRARYANGGQHVAIKVLVTGRDSDPTSLARFEREAAILKKLKHPNIVRLHGTGRTHGTPFFIMEFIDGESLESRLDNHKRFTWEEVVQLGQQICAALQHAHEQGIVHRDLKPANIMLTADGSVKLTDFGIAKGLYMVEQITATHCTVGTASYMSPEQCRGDRDLTAKSDLYSLGVMLYELLTGVRPFQATTILDMFKAHLEGTFERPSRVVLDIPIWLDTLVCQLLEKDPDKRPLNAALVSQALDRVVEKMAAMRSAAEDAVGKGVLDRPRTDLKPTDEDREAARLIKAAAHKKRLKPRSHPVYQRVWFQAAAVAALLLGIGVLVYWATRPPAPERLFERAQKLMATKNPDDAEKARDGPIHDYLHAYPDRADDQAVQMRAWADDVDAARKEKQLRNRLRVGLSPEGEHESTARAALQAEDKGDLTAAREHWQALAQGRDSRDEARRPWGLLGANRLRDLDEVDQLEAQLKGRVRDVRRGSAAGPAGGDTERQALLATRAQMFGDATLARDKWRDLQERYQKDAEHRTWFLLAAKKGRELRSQATDDREAAAKKRRELVKEKLKQANERAETDPFEARALCRDIQALYADDPDGELGQLTEQARKLLQSLTSE
jgi:serine/threonine-protein kinase